MKHASIVLRKVPNNAWGTAYRENTAECQESADWFLKATHITRTLLIHYKARKLVQVHLHQQEGFTKCWGRDFKKWRHTTTVLTEACAETDIVLLALIH